jgi:diguanylate cyclase (GGDEF)-like protein
VDKRLILVADDDHDVVRYVEVNLRMEGFEVATASDGLETLSAAAELVPDLILLDVMMPEMDGFEVCQRLRKDPKTKHIAIVMLTAKSLSSDRVVGLTAGADDYVIKPFDPAELVARVKLALRRTREMHDVNPLTHLPGNIQIQQELSKRMAAGSEFALLNIDLDNFKAFNDHYGFLRGDEAIKTLARCVREATEEADSGSVFVGHVGGDDFVAMVDPGSASAAAEAIISRWDSQAPGLYDREDAENGYIEVLDRRRKARRVSITTVSVGIASTASRPISGHLEAVEIATEMKSVAKGRPGSSFAVDRRKT